MPYKWIGNPFSETLSGRIHACYRQYHQVSYFHERRYSPGYRDHHPGRRGDPQVAGTGLPGAQAYFTCFVDSAIYGFAVRIGFAMFENYQSILASPDACGEVKRSPHYTAQRTRTQEASSSKESSERIETGLPVRR